MKQFTSPHQKIGLYGEKEAEMFLVKHGFIIVERNFSSKSGEIDLICRKNNKLHFIEVKSVTVSHVTSFDTTGARLEKVPRETPTDDEITNVSRVTLKNSKNKKMGVSRETFLKENKKLLNPFQNVSQSKIKKLIRTIEQYLNLKSISRETPWQCDGIGVYLNPNMTLQKIDYLAHITIR